MGSPGRPRSLLSRFGEEFPGDTVAGTPDSALFIGNAPPYRARGGADTP